MASFESSYKDTTVALWEILYEVRLSDIGSRNLEELKMFGHPVSGIKEIDMYLKHNPIDRWMCIADMVDYYREGIPIRLINHSDTKEIYEAITEHIYAWRNVCEYGVNQNNAPLEDLVWMDQFAEKVYGHASNYIDKSVREHLVMSDFGGGHELNAMNIFTNVEEILSGKPVTPGISVFNKIEEPPKRESLMEFFLSKTPI